MTSSKNYLLACNLLLSLCVASCSFSPSKQGRRTATARVQSAPYELLVVANKAWLTTAAGRAFVEVVESPIDGLPQVEPNFRATYINPYDFKGTFRTYGNIVMVDVNRKYEKATMRVGRNEYAKPQILIRIEAPDDESMIEYLESHGETILAKLNANEFGRERALLTKKHSGVVLTQMKRQFAMQLYAPEDIDKVKQGRQFFWASSEKQDFRLNVCVYAVAVQDVSVERLVELRDSVMRVNIPGGREGQWMETDVRTVVGGFVEVDDRQVFTVRGLWDMRNDAMGGPFVCYVYPDYANDRLLVVEGFAFAPEEKKRAMVRRLEATLQTLAPL